MTTLLVLTFAVAVARTHTHTNCSSYNFGSVRLRQPWTMDCRSRLL